MSILQNFRDATQNFFILHNFLSPFRIWVFSITSLKVEGCQLKMSCVLPQFSRCEERTVIKDRFQECFVRPKTTNTLHSKRRNLLLHMSKSTLIQFSQFDPEPLDFDTQATKELHPKLIFDSNNRNEQSKQFRLVTRKHFRF